MDEGLRLHLALCTVAERLAGVMERARFERRDGYVFVMFPTFPIPSFNGVWPDDDSAAGALSGALAEVTAEGIETGVLARIGETPAVDEAARELGLTAAERIPGMVANAGDLIGPATPELDVIASRLRTGSLRHWPWRQRGSNCRQIFWRRCTCSKSQAWTDSTYTSAGWRVAM